MCHFNDTINSNPSLNITIELYNLTFSFFRFIGIKKGKWNISLGYSIKYQLFVYDIFMTIGFIEEVNAKLNIK